MSSNSPSRNQRLFLRGVAAGIALTVFFPKAAPAQCDAGEAACWQTIAPFFSPPAEFAGKLGDYRLLCDCRRQPAQRPRTGADAARDSPTVARLDGQMAPDHRSRWSPGTKRENFEQR